MADAPIKLTSVAVDALKEMKPQARRRVIDVLKTELVSFIEEHPSAHISGLEDDFWVLQTDDDGPVIVAKVHGEPAEPIEYVVTAVLDEDSKRRPTSDLSLDTEAIDLGREVLSYSTKLNA